MCPACRGPEISAGAVFFRAGVPENAAGVTFFPAGATEIHTQAIFFIHQLLKFIHGQFFSIQVQLKHQHDDLSVMQGFLESLQGQFFSRLGN
jgi:hypothetical protein